MTNSAIWHVNTDDFHFSSNKKWFQESENGPMKRRKKTTTISIRAQPWKKVKQWKKRRQQWLHREQQRRSIIKSSLRFEIKKKICSPPRDVTSSLSPHCRVCFLRLSFSGWILHEIYWSTEVSRKSLWKLENKIFEYFIFPDENRRLVLKIYLYHR